jgi:hypothetical protein
MWFQWDVMRAWVASGLASEPRCSSQPTSAGYAILHGSINDLEVKATGCSRAEDGEAAQRDNDRLSNIVLEDHSHSGR